MRTKPVWNHNYKVVWKLLPETKREWYRLNGGQHIAMKRDKVIDDLWDRNGFRKFHPPFPSKRTDRYDSIWCY